MLPHLDDFLLNLQANKYSFETIYNYERDLNVFSNFLDESNIEFDRVDKRAITYYKAYLVSRDRKTAKLAKQGEKQLDSRSINRMLSALRAYLRYLIDIDYRCPVPPEAVKLTKAGKKHPQVAELGDLIRLIEAPNVLESNAKTALRNRAMLEVLFSTGMRISELCNLNRSQIDDTGRIFITGKGRKQRFVYLTPRAKQHVDAYLMTRQDDCPALFIPYAGRNVAKSKRRISTNYLQDRIKRYREKLKINVPTSAHSLRHGFATYLAEEGANPAALQILLGHESLDTTTRYVHASDKYAEETHRKYHPLANPG
ncbi:MAG: tyrosine-type recombinase/integrase [Dehalococcoidia bacterium]|nr:tyrosine-type recombinase/integrase [Dehalococcoidia bacterium]MDH4366907.1 tyrosine-type recombinase/integrase [Dehalococcoidia bacterium]